MKKWIVIAVIFCLAAVPVFADVSNDIIVGIDGDSTSKVESNFITDPKSKIDSKNSLFTFQYTHFFTPLKDDGKPIDLRQFYQHRSTLSSRPGAGPVPHPDHDGDHGWGPPRRTDQGAEAAAGPQDGQWNRSPER